MMKSSKLMALAALVAAALGACGPQQDDPSAQPAAGVDSSESPIINAPLTSVADQRTFGLVQLPGCSGALLSTNWVITAAHCLSGFSTAGYTVSVPGDVANTSVSRTVDAFYTQPGGADVALIHVSGALPNAWPTNINRAIDTRAQTALLGTSVTCYGQGPGTLQDPNTNTWGDYAGYRSGIFTIDFSGEPGTPDENLWGYHWNGSQQMVGPGDSGGPCFALVSGTWVHVGNNHSVAYSYYPDTGVVANMQGYAVGTAPYRTWVQSTAVELKTYPTMNLRGTINSWGNTAMTFIGDHLWQAQLTLTAGTTYQYKYDALGNWATTSNWGDTNNDGTAVLNSSNISYTAPVAGTYFFRFNESTLAYSVIAPPVTTTIRVHNDVGYGNTVYLRGSVEPLFWGFGVATTWTTGNVWTYSTTAIPAGAAFQYKPLKNDTVWSTGANYNGTGGATLDIYPTF